MQKLPAWVLANARPSLYDVEIATLTQMTARVYGAMNEMINEFNSFTEQSNKTLDEIGQQTIKAQQDFETKIIKANTEFFKCVKDYVKENSAATLNSDINNPALLEKINTDSFYVKELKENINLQKDTEFISLFDKGVFKSQAGINSIIDSTLFKNRKVIASTTEADNLTAEFRKAFSAGQYLNILGTQEFDVIVYIPDVSKINKIELRLTTYIDANQNVTLTKTAAELKTGWNYIRFATQNASLIQWGECSMVRILTYTTEPTTLYFADIMQVKPAKAKVIFVDDHAYSDFKINAYPQLKAAGIPVTWAIQPGRPGQEITGAGNLLSVEEMDELATDPYSEFSFHSYNGANTNTMTADELKSDCQKSISFLRKNGLLPKNFWRAAWKNNDAPAARECDALIDGGAYYGIFGGLETFPFTNKYNILRYSIHNRSTSDIDNVFNILKRTHCTVVFYTHGYITVAEGTTNTTIHVTNYEFDYFMSKLYEGINEGWIEGTTFDRLARKYEILEF